MTPRQENLARLAFFLENLPEDYVHFDMESYFHDPLTDMKTEQDEIIHSHRLITPTQGMCGCPLGHSLAAGIVPRTNFTTWKDFAKDAYGVSGISFQFLFGGEWYSEDNTPVGAANRIWEYLGDHHTVKSILMPHREPLWI